MKILEIKFEFSDQYIQIYIRIWLVIFEYIFDYVILPWPTYFPDNMVPRHFQPPELLYSNTYSNMEPPYLNIYSNTKPTEIKF